MDFVALDERLRTYTQGHMGLALVLSGYLDEVRHAASVLGVELQNTRFDQARARIEIGLVEAPDLLVYWTPLRGWAFEHGDQGSWVASYRVGSETDVASAVPDAGVVAAWLRVLANGDRVGHGDPPEALDALDEALVDRLTTLGVGSDPHSPG